jgi:hypothetical protein
MCRVEEALGPHWLLNVQPIVVLRYEVCVRMRMSGMNLQTGRHRHCTSPPRAPTWHDGHQHQDKVLSAVEAIIACTSSAGDVFGRLIYDLGRGDGGA